MRAAELGQLRVRGARHGLIRQHRGLRQLNHRPRDVIAALALTLVMTLVWFAVLPAIGDFWSLVIGAANTHLNLGGVLGEGMALIPRLSLPRLVIPLSRPSDAGIVITIVVCALAFVGTLRLPDRMLPLTYGIRAILLVELSAAAFFLVTRSGIGSIPNVADASLSGGAAIIGVLPALLGLTLYLFDPSIARNAISTVLVMSHLIVLLPLQYLLQIALMSHGSLLLAPFCFFVLGPVLDVMVVVAFYGWAMSLRPPAKPAHPSGVS
jgi:hypothetical protein